MIRSSIISSLVLSLLLVGGCKKGPEGTTPPEDGATASTKKEKKEKKEKKDRGEDSGDTGGSAADEEDPVKKVCPAETADFPEPYFDDTLLIRLPKGVNADNFVEMQPGFVRLAGKVESVSCIEDLPGGMISFMAMAAFQDDGKKGMAEFRDETLAAFGYTSAKLTEEKLDDKKRFFQAVLEVPADDGNPEPARALFQMASANGMMYAIVFETHPNAWNALKETFYSSAKAMSFLKP